MNRFDILIKDCHVLLEDHTVLSNAVMGIRKGKIAMIAEKGDPQTAIEAKETIDGRGKLAMPEDTCWIGQQRQRC